MPSITLLGESENIEIKNFKLPYGTPLTELDDALMFGCRMAACGACAIEILEGENNLSPIQDLEKNFLEDIGLANSNYRLACQCKVLGNIVIKQC